MSQVDTFRVKGLRWDSRGDSIRSGSDHNINTGLHAPLIVSHLPQLRIFCSGH
jgi:hypothetical protein